MGGGVWVVVCGGGYWTGGGTLLGGQALEISVVCFSSFRDGRGLEFELGWGEWLGWGLGTWQRASHSRKLASFTRTKEAVLDTAWLSERSTPVITHKNRNSEMWSARVVAQIDCCLLTAALSIHISLFYVDKVKGIS